MPFDITVLAEGFNDTILHDLQFEPDDTFRVTFRLGHPEFLLSRDEVIVELNQGDSALFDIEIANNGNRRLEYSVSKHIPGMDPWSLVNRKELNDEGEYRYYGVVMVEDSLFYVSAHTPEGNKIFVINVDGEILDEFPQPGESTYGIRGLAWDGELIWGIDGQAVYSIDLNGGVRWNWDIQEDRYQSITWDSDNEILWMARITGLPILGYDREGNLVSTLEWNEPRLRIYGLAYNSNDPDGHGLYVQHHYPSNDNSPSGIYKINTTNNNIMFFKTLFSEEEGRFEGGFISDSYIPNATALIGIFNESETNRYFVDIWLMDIYTGWIDLDTMEGIIEPDQSQNFELMIRTDEITTGEFSGNLIFQHNAIGESDTLSVQLQNMNSASKESALSPYSFGITSTYPNPFNSKTTIKYSLPSPCHASLQVYNTLGQQVTTLFKGYRQAGIHSVTLSASDLSSGLYFVQLKAADKAYTQKMILLR